MSTNDQFDAAAFMSGVTAKDEMSTVVVQVPEGDYVASIPPEKAVTVRHWEKDGNEGYILSIGYELDDPSLEELTGKDKNWCFQSIFLDVETDAKGKMSLACGEGKNVDLGKLREALDCNEGTFAIDQIIGRGPVMVKVKHGKDQNDEPKAEVRSVTTLPA